MERVSADRRLTTILSADVAGYSRMMASDEPATLAKLRSLQSDLIEPKTNAFNGRVVKLMGDGFLLEFGSVIAAVRFAVELQQALSQWNGAVHPALAFALRIGVNIGDVIVDGDDIFGDDVNIAARLHQLAEPGSICISAKVFDEIRNKVEFSFRDLGDREVKNIREPVHVFEVLEENDGTGKPVAEPKPARPRHFIWFAAAVGLAAVSTAAVFLYLRQPDAPSAPEGTDRAAPNAGDWPSVVVLPFENLSDKASEDYFADGITEDLTTALSKLPGLFVISRNSAFTYKGKAPIIKDVGAELGVKFVLQGNVRRIGNQVRINIQLIEALTDGSVWAERFDGNLSDVFALQDRVAANVVDALSLKLLPGQVQKFSGPGTSDTAAYDAYLRGLSRYYLRTPSGNAHSAVHFEESIRLDPGFAAAYTALAKAYYQAAVGEHAYADELGIHWADGFTRARRLLEQGMTRPNADAHVLQSWLALRKRQYSKAISEAKQALDINPNNADALEATAEAMIYAGQSEDGIRFANQAMRQNPTLRARPLFLIGVSEFALGHFDKAVERISQAIREQPERKADFSGVLAAAMGVLGQSEEARAAFRTFSQGIVNRPSLAWSVKAQTFANPRYHTWRRADVAWGVFSYPFADRLILDRLANGLLAAGATESVGGYLALDRKSRLGGAEIQLLLFGEEISGKNFWLSDVIWRQRRTAQGTVTHEGDSIHPGLPAIANGKGQIRDDLLCEIWPALSRELELCVLIFRVSESKARLRWGDYVMVTDTGPQPFSLRQ